MKPIVVTAATTLELSQLIVGLGAAPLPGSAPLQCQRGEAGGREVILALTGIGKVNAACAAALLLERYQPELLINTGCGGACPGSGLSVGELAIASEECLADEGVETPEGWHGLELIGIPLLKPGGEPVFNRLPVSQELAREAFDCAVRHGHRVHVGPFHTVSTCSGTTRRGEELVRRYPGICENMEGGALALVAASFGVPFLEVRGISNLVEDRDLSRWELKRAVAEAQGFLLTYLKAG